MTAAPSIVGSRGASTYLGRSNPRRVQASNRWDRGDVGYVALVMVSSINSTVVPQVVFNAVVAGALLFRSLVGVRGRDWRFDAFAPWLMVALCVLSLLWSDNRGSTTWAAGSLAFYTLVAVHVVASMSSDVVVRGVSWGFRTILGLSAAVAVASPSTAFVSTAYEAGALRGIAVHRNIFGFLVALALITFVFEWTTRRRRGWLGASSIAVAGIFLVLSRSQTSLIIGVTAAVAVTIGWRVARSDATRRGLWLVLSMLGAGAVAVAAGLLLEPLLLLIGRDVTLTGRTTIWQFVLEAIERRPLAGYGMGAVWEDGDPVGDQIRHLLGFSISHAHNGYLNLAVELGWLGTALAVAILAVAAVRCTRALLAGDDAGALFLTIVAAIAAFNIFESRVTYNTAWILIVVSYCVASPRRRALIPGTRPPDTPDKKERAR